MKARELLDDVVNGFRELRVDGAVVYPWSVRDGLGNIVNLGRNQLASGLLRVAYHVANGSIVIQRVESSSLVPRNVAVALQSDAFTYAALAEVCAAHPDLYGPEDDDGYWPRWRDGPPG